MIDDSYLFAIKGDDLVLLRDYAYTYKGKKYIIPKDFHFDGASIPQLFWSLIGNPLESEFRQSAMKHDWAYITHALSFADANNEFLESLKIHGVSWIKRNLMWSAVSTAGWFFYRGVDKVDLKWIKEILRDREDKAEIEKTIKIKYYHTLP